MRKIWKRQKSLSLFRWNSRNCEYLKMYTDGKKMDVKMNRWTFMNVLKPFFCVLAMFLVNLLQFFSFINSNKLICYAFAFTFLYEKSRSGSILTFLSAWNLTIKILNLSHSQFEYNKTKKNSNFSIVNHLNILDLIKTYFYSQFFNSPKHFSLNRKNLMRHSVVLIPLTILT
jgi:hypothetical protein